MRMIIASEATRWPRRAFFLWKAEMNYKFVKEFLELKEQVKSMSTAQTQTQQDLATLKSDYEAFKKLITDGVTALLAQITNLQGQIVADPAIDQGIKDLSTEIMTDTTTFKNQIAPPVVVPPPVVGPAFQLAFASAPVGGPAGMPLAAVKVNVNDSTGALVTTDISTVSIAVDNGGFTGDSILLVAAVGGVATFSNLNLAMAGTYVLTASDGTLTPAVAAPISIV